MLSEKTLPVTKPPANDASELVQAIQRIKSSEAFELPLTQMMEYIHSQYGIAFADLELQTFSESPNRLTLFFKI